MSQSPDRIASYHIVTKGGSAEITEKRSRFIADVFAVQTVQEAEAAIAEVSKRTWDAKHHCHAFICGMDGALSRCSDNGEPAGTAGKPILEVIKGAGLTDTLIVVTRYFGGILLGTGGLVRAYTQAAQAGLAASETGEMVLARTLTLSFGYELVGNVQYVLRTAGLPIRAERYTAEVEYDVLVPQVRLTGLQEALVSRTDGRIRMTEGTEGYSLLS
ncbi:MAG: YigZ family protein [Butyrivibrio sp.]|nr:YigZ family protein [Butyrivibrio sp.]